MNLTVVPLFLFLDLEYLQQKDSNHRVPWNTDIYLEKYL